MRWFAVAACACAVAGTVAIVVASAATGTGFGYVSEAGVPGAPLAGLYRAGVFAVAAALALLAVALRAHLGVGLTDLRPREGAATYPESEPTLSFTNENHPTLGNEARPAPTKEAHPTLTNEARPAQTDENRPALAGEAHPAPTNEAGTALTDDTGHGVLRVAADPSQGSREPGSRWQRALAQACSRRAADPGRRLDLDRLAGMIAVLALALAAPLAATSGAVPCTTGCPLPPYESASHQDIAHAVASIGGFGLAAVAMIVLALPSLMALTVLTVPTDPTEPAGTASSATTAAMPAPPGRAGPAGPAATAGRLRTASRLGAGLAVPLLAAAGLAMLIVGRGLLTGTLERAALLTSLGWLVAAAATVATTRPSPAGSADSAGAAMRRRT